MSEKTWFEDLFEDHLMLRDITLVAFTTLFYGASMPLILAYVSDGSLSLNFMIGLGLGTGVHFSVLYWPIMEHMARLKGESMFRYFFGGDPLEELEE